jgi:O-antigen/teichoic acid export membrane protein
MPTDTLVDSVLILLALNVVQRLVGFVRAMLFCRWLDAEQLGQWDMAFNFLMLAAPLAVLAIPGVFGRYTEHYRHRGQLRAFLERTMFACGGLALAAFAVVLLARRWFSLLIFGSEDQTTLVVAVAGSLLAIVAYNFLIELFTGLRNIRLVSSLQLLNSVAFAVLGVVLLFRWRCTAESVVIAYGGSCVLAAVWAGFALRRAWLGAPPAAEHVGHIVVWGRVAPYAGWMLLGSVLTNLFGMIDRYMIVHFSHTSAADALDIVGNYHASRLMPLLLISIAVMLGGIITPHLSHDWEAGRRELVAQRLRLFLKTFGFLLFAAAVAVLLVAPLVFHVALRGKFPLGQEVLPWTLAYCNWFGMMVIAQNYLFCAEKTKLSSISLAAGLLLNIGMNLLLLPRYGLTGAVLSTTASTVLTLSLICRFNRRLGFRLDGGTRATLLLPAFLCFGPWAAVPALIAFALLAVFGNRLLSADEKRQLVEGLSEYRKRFGLGATIAP